MRLSDDGAVPLRPGLRNLKGGLPRPMSDTAVRP